MTTIPTLAELNAAIIADMEATFNITIPTVGPSFLRNLAAVNAGEQKIQYLALASVQKNIFADTADPESMGGTLQRFGLVKLDRNPFTAVAAEYTVEVTGSIGAIIPASTIFKSDDDSLNPGKNYILDDAFTLTSSPDSITLRALEGGDDSALSIGDTLTITIPVALVNSSAEVTAETVEPQEAESIEEYRQKVLEAYRLEAQGGSASDYRLWAADAQGVDQTYPYVVAGNSNQINLYVEATIADSTDGKGTPSATILSAVEAAVEDPTVDRPARKPLGVFQVNYLPVVVKDVTISVTGFSGLTAAIQAAILAEVTEQIALIRPFIGAIEIPANENDILSVNNVINMILTANPGSIFTGVTLTVGGSPVSTYTFDNGEIPYLVSISYP